MSHANRNVPYASTELASSCAVRRLTIFSHPSDEPPNCKPCGRARKPLGWRWAWVTERGRGWTPVNPLGRTLDRQNNSAGPAV